MGKDLASWTNYIQRHPLFSGASEDAFTEFMEDCQVKRYEAGDHILYSKSLREGLILILEGMAEVYVTVRGRSNEAEVLEVVEPGEMVGLSSLADFLGEPKREEYSHTVEVRAVENVVCLRIPYHIIEKRWEHDHVRDYILRQVSIRLRDIYASLAEQVYLASQWGDSDPFIERVQDIMTAPPVKVNVDTPLSEVAYRMTSNNASSVIVEENNRLVGIITETDLVKRVIAAGIEKEGTAKDVMTASPLVISKLAYYYEAMANIFVQGVKHLPVTEDDDPTKVVGMITLSDLLKKQHRGKFNIIQEIEHVTEETLPTIKDKVYAVLGNLIEDEIPAFHTLKIITEFNDRLIKQCVKMAEEETRKDYGEPPVPYAFYLMGSAGRAEQFMFTDQDHFLVYHDPEKQEDKDRISMYFRKLGNAIVLWLERAGYKRCDGNMMASEQNWRGSITNWESRLHTWGLRATNENILLSNNFLSFRYLHGDEQLHDDFVKMVAKKFEKSQIFLFRAAEIELSNPIPNLDHPIRALFRLKRTGMDIKKHALFPFHHALQILAAKHEVYGMTPYDMVKKLEKKEVFTAPFADELLFAYETILRIRMTQSWQRYERGETNSSEIKFIHMRSRDKEALMIALKTIRTLQAYMKNAFGML